MPAEASAAPSPLNAALDRIEDAHGLIPPDEAIYEEFVSWAESTGRPLYPHQEEALLAAYSATYKQADLIYRTA